MEKKLWSNQTNDHQIWKCLQAIFHQMLAHKWWLSLSLIIRRSAALSITSNECFNLLLMILCQKRSKLYKWGHGTLLIKSTLHRPPIHDLIKTKLHFSFARRHRKRRSIRRHHLLFFSCPCRHSSLKVTTYSLSIHPFCQRALHKCQSTHGENEWNTFNSMRILPFVSLLQWTIFDFKWNDVISHAVDMREFVSLHLQISNQSFDDDE